MGFIRRVLLVLACVIFLFSILAAGILLTLSSSLRYENVKPELASFLGNVVSISLDFESQLNQLMPAMEIYCQSNQQYNFVYGKYIFAFPCDVILQGPNSLIEYGVNSLVDKYYHTEYDCGFWDCFEKEDIPLFLISAKAQTYWQSKFYFILMFTLALAALIFILVEKKTNFFLLTGILTIVASFSIRYLSRLASLFSSSSEGIGGYISQIVLIFLNQSRNVFIKLLLIGGALIIICIVLKIFKLGFVISNLFAKIKIPKQIGKIKPDKKIEPVKKDIGKNKKVEASKKTNK
jgi:hypothetical protein